MSSSGEISVVEKVDPEPSDAKASDAVTSRDPFGTVQLDAYARHLATELLISSCPANLAKKFRQRYNDNVKTIQAAYAACLSLADQDHPSLSVNDWLVDNYYVVLEQIRDVRDHLPPSFYRELPKLEGGRPRIHALAYELTAHSDSALDEDLLVRFIDQFQTNAELTIGELWAFPVMLRLVLIENLAQIAGQIQEELKSASDANVLHSIWKSERRIQLFHPSSLRSAATLIALHDKLRNAESPNDGGLTAFKRNLHSLGWDLVELRRLEQHRLASNQVTIGNIITSMRLLTGLDWVVFFEQTNRTERILRRDPAKVYARMDLASRNRCRTAVEQLAKRSGKTESEIAEIVLKTADENSIAPATVTVAASASKTSTEVQASAEFAAVKKHVGYWLIDDGRLDTEAAIHYRPTVGERFKRIVGCRPNLVYFGGLLLLNAILIAAFAAVCFVTGVAWLPLVLFTLLAIVPITDVAVLILNTMITRIATVRLLPKLDYSDGIDPQFPTFIVVPSMLTSHREAKALLARLENHYLANTDSNFFYSLLTDFADADAKHAIGDDEILQTEIAGIQSLNKKYQRQGKQPFYFFHRERRWNTAQEKWMGWERKRGKLLEFGRLLRGSTDTSYDVIEGDVASLDSFRSSTNRPFVITLDADTVLPRGAAQKLVGTLAHPLNRPIVSQGSQAKVVRGYSILQPRVSIHLNESRKTRYLQIHAANPGIDPYASAASDVYQDLFRDGSFTGKGIYDLRAFDSTLEQTFPENQILSHDLIEGCHARVALVSDIEVFDGYPGRYDVDAKRMHRWVRGDWQISPWLLWLQLSAK